MSSARTASISIFGTGKEDLYPRWVFRYSINGQPRTLGLGSYRDVSAAMARKEAARLRGLIAIGHDVADEKRKQARAAVADTKAQVTVAELADQFYARYVDRRRKHPRIVRPWIDKKINPAIGKLPVARVQAADLDELIQSVSNDAPTVAPKLLSRLKAMFNLGIRLNYISTNPAAAFEASDAGPPPKSRDRWLTKVELSALKRAMDLATGWGEENSITVYLLLVLAVRKGELIGAKIEEFDLLAGHWGLPAERTKSSSGILIPLPKQAQAAIGRLIELGRGGEWLLPARRLGSREAGHISPDTLNAALAKSVRPHMDGVKRFTVHDFRRTARTHLEALDVDPIVAERCLNHKIRGLVGIYNRHDYYDKRKAALQSWADLLEAVWSDDRAHDRRAQALAGSLASPD